MTFPQLGSIPSKYKKLTIAVVAVTALAVGIGYFTRSKPIPVLLQTVERGTVEASVSNTRAGTVNACRRAKMSPAAGGQISKLQVKKGQRVKKGQVLLELWDNDLHAQERLAQEQLKVSQSRVNEVCTLADAAQRDAVRSQELRNKGFISAQQLDRALTDASSKQSACNSAKGDIDQSKSRIALARATLDRMVLRAPFDGVVADISGELGEYATPSPPGIPTLPAIDLIDDSCMYVSAPIDEVDASKLKIGQRSRITLDAIKGRVFGGKVRRIAPYVLDLEKQARTVEVEVEFDKLNEKNNLLVGYSADVEIIYDVRNQVLRIPTQTLLEGNRVLRYGNDGVLEERKVTTGLSNWEYAEVTSGLEEGDRVVSSLDRPGVKAGVRAVPEQAKPAK
ncbi:efflux RND transporter periplasmic adaptor subunit [Sideroxydans lithotrophicus]|uniref:Efflux transporter, RND family, MFP subunit n=1 Tax=Sideroxydans lithotrophicus (strain ES-1) TaxID=580332 RepID=D5CTZ6_SIDLE|nr:efflux RND transporter periplasmic adaptor subunit [Sideroxydans lithotrophicus]ADE12308.1 efflux transporter, RND family, MFP subunit [Sideroxydans lithotrophicus ES-1]